MGRSLLELLLGLLEALRLALAGLGQRPFLLGNALHAAASTDPAGLASRLRFLALDVAFDRVSLGHPSLRTRVAPAETAVSSAAERPRRRARAGPRPPRPRPA